MELKTTQRKVIDAAMRFPSSLSCLKFLFPEAFPIEFEQVESKNKKIAKINHNYEEKK